MNQKQKKELLIPAMLWTIIFLGIALHGLFAARTYILMALWIIFILGLLIVLSALEKYVVIKVK